MTDDQRRRLRRSGLVGLITLVGVYLLVIAIDRGRNVATFSVVYAVLILWPAWRYVAAPLIDSVRGRAGIVTGPIRFARRAGGSGDSRFVYVGAERLRVASPAQLKIVVADQAYLLRYAPITRVLLDVEPVGEDGDL